ncbi:hypothetical protein PHET_03309 [Paragonimus heterotremus]|uniref:CS domain-containing protein n=1 Tax=Paragonimus heterotremus TaxID=100268 RepID=A0A8J4WJS9_9TREM|nr:hypothetical protein PHET_03309 [Paragonimus heterotremus]
MCDFADRVQSPFVRCPWGRWWQAIEEVFVEIFVPQGTKSKEVRCHITSHHIDFSCGDSGPTLSGKLWQHVKSDECVWSLQDRNTVLICLVKANRDPHTCLWPSLFTDAWEADSWTRDQMEQQITLERLQLDNPGMDFSDAHISGNYRDGGPRLLSYLTIYCVILLSRDDKDTLLNRHFVHGGQLPSYKPVTESCTTESDASESADLSGLETRRFYESLVSLSPVSSVSSDSNTATCMTCGSKLRIGTSYKEHLSSVGHQVAELSAQPKRPSDLMIPRSNVGYQLLERIGWSDCVSHSGMDNDKLDSLVFSPTTFDTSHAIHSVIQTGGGLGPHGQGRRHPVSTVLKRDRFGLGWTNTTKQTAKVTHFAPHDVRAVELPFRVRNAASSSRLKLDKQFQSRKLKLDKAREKRLRAQLNLSDEHFVVLHGS